MATNVNAAWLDIDSTEYYSHCGDTSGHTAQEMLDGTDAWWHLINHEHELIVDLGSSANVAKIRTKNDGLANNDDIDVYVSDNPASWGTAVMTGIDISGDSDTDWTERVLDVQ